MANETAAAKPELTPVKLADMNAAQLQKHIDELDEKHRTQIKHLRALLRCMQSGIS